MSAERWFAARSEGVGRVLRLRGQPEDGFGDIGHVMGWLEGQGLIRHVEAPEPWWVGWGDPYCAVDGERDDPWESAESQLAEDQFLRALEAMRNPTDSEGKPLPFVGERLEGYRAPTPADLGLADLPLATRVLRARVGRWDAWAMESGGVWVWIGKAWTRRGALRLLPR